MKEKNDRPRIAMLGQKRTFSRDGGVEIAVTELASRMAEKGYDVTCFDRGGRRSPSAERAKPACGGVKVRRVPTLDIGGLAAVTSSIMGALCAAFGRYDIVHFHAEGPSAVCWLPKMFGARVICTVHGLDWQREKWNRFASAYILGGEKSSVKHADEIIVLNESTQRYFQREYGRKTVVIPNGTDRPEKHPAELIRQLWGLEAEGYVLFVGRLVPEKGLRTLLKAWNGIKTDKKLVIAGGSAASEGFLRELKEFSGENVIFTGFVMGQALQELYSNAYLYVLPSDLEGMPLSLLEAMSYGCCCLVSDIPGCVETVYDKAVRFEHGSAEALREALLKLLSDRDTVERYRSGAADFISEKYNWDNTVKMTLEAYFGK